MVYGYIRVSSDKQTVENQRYEILRFCEKEHLRVDEWIEETVSGTFSWKKRKLGKILYRVGPQDLIICSELSRLGRNLYWVMDILSQCMQSGCRVWTIKDQYRLGDDIQSKVLAFAFGLSAEIERDLISQRTREALARIKSEGKHLGRARGSRNRQETNPLFEHHEYIQEAYTQGVTLTAMCHEIQCNRSTLKRYIERFVAIENEQNETDLDNENNSIQTNQYNSTN